MNSATAESRFEAPWRMPAPRARKVATALYGWRDPGWVFLAAVLAALPFMMAAAFSPALLSLTPTVEMIGPIAQARAIADGAASLRDAPAPFYAGLLLAADLFAESPGRIHLVAKAIAAGLVAYPFAWLAAARMPAVQAVLLTAALAAYVAAPFSGPAEIAVAFLMVTGFALVCPPADEHPGRARSEGALAGCGLAALWMLNPVIAFAGFVALAVCPALAEKGGATRYMIAAAVFAVLSVGCEALAPGVNAARAAAASIVLTAGLPVGGEGALALGGLAACTAAVLGAAAVFGGAEHWRGWAAGVGFVLVAALAARLAQANPTPVFVAGATLACFSVASPFYDGVFRNHDRASVAIATVVAALTLFWTGSMLAHASGQYLLQERTAREAPANIRSELALVQPGGPTIARWVEEGRFSTPEARELFALAPVDQSAMLLEAAAQARQIASHGFDVAILTGADSACVIAEKRACRATGEKAANAAKVVFVPRLDLDPATKAAKGKSEALLYTEFRLVEQTALWDVWVRRGASLPAELTLGLKAL